MFNSFTSWLRRPATRRPIRNDHRPVKTRLAVESLEDRVTPSATILGISTDTGISNTDFITKDNTLSLSGTATDNSNPITISVDGSAVGTTTASGGVWNFDLPSPLADGVHTLTATHLGVDSSQLAEIDTSAPTLASIVRLGPSSASATNANQVTFRVTFNDDLNNFAGLDDIRNLSASDFALTTTGSISGASIASISAPVDAEGRVFDVTVNTGTGNGTIRLDFKDLDATVSDRAGNNGIANFTTGQVFTIDESLQNPVITTQNQGPFKAGVNAAVNLGSFTSSSTIEKVLAGDFNKDGIQDLIVIEQNNTGSGMTEIHVLNGADNFQSYLAHTATALGATGSNWDFQLADINKDGVLDLVGILRTGSSSGTTELHVLSGATNFQTFLLHTATALGQTGANWSFQVADINRDGILDLVGILQSGSGSGKTELHVLDGASNFQSFNLHIATALGATPTNWVFRVADLDKDGIQDLVGILQGQTGSGIIELHVLSGISNFQSFSLHTATGLGVTGSNWDFQLADFDRDGRLDLGGLLLNGSTSGRIELHALSGISNFQTFNAHFATAQPQTHSFLVTVDWGDSSSDDSFTVFAPGPLGVRNHVFATAGTYTVTVTVTEDNGLSATSTFDVTVSP